ncbi:30S ribosomal protein S17 [Candidatus Roizmanbacteria bacterium CG_4_10_14_0_8_um_filter_35_28]|uniref:Small ribosomal subunit protein uS17 n=2 Tax=Candidatus Roizmaniibacteriota TaxID=1752723 RepID=A0A2G9Y7L2_9BACT|nr:MAG: 30S ribosomal protein S17 [Candidatus Roizmanbacteria bacterium CG23_combo_of_CG06-09_8_20_14_all_35_49]PIY71188.1 MAG: 30S ribosomal protein S17 [Candidatus Roizmanbacteria bacterium CG_4_10_14_0_8_um_filter_35_28]PJC82616.1 MAG: 30S ribosomal protein S17 [Candidatus Roizmanbacteria bacterium CG_4_8_14_3_um_filter_35_14]
MKKILIGKVVSNKMLKTVVVMVERKFRYPLYKKVITRHKKYQVHNEDLQLNVGDIVKISETKPISKNKHFIVIEKINDKSQITNNKSSSNVKK